MKNQNNRSNEEVDLFYLFNKISDLFNKVLVALYNFIGFVFRNWILILGVVLGGVIYGYYLDSNRSVPKNSEMLIRINFNTGNYIYNAVSLLNEKVNNRDSVFLANRKLWQDGSSLVKSLEISPVVNFNDLMEEYGSNNRTFEMLFEKYEFDEDLTASKSFQTDYIYHKLDVKLSSRASVNTLDNIVSYLNESNLLNKLKIESLAHIKQTLEQNKKSIESIDKLLENYSSVKDNLTNKQIALDKDLTGLVDKKIYLQTQIASLKDKIVLSDQIVVMISKPELYVEEQSFLTKKIVLYPILFLFTLFLIVIFKNSYIKGKKLANQDK